MDRYHRQTLLPQIGEEGQHRLASSRVLLVGCGALGTVIAEQLVRGGVGFLRICDRDIVELTNLQRQTLFDESDAAAATPKAIAAASRLSAINSTVQIEPRVIDVHSGNAEALAEGIEIILDGTDNAETRYLLNDVAVKHSVPWVYGACVGTGGRVMAIVPGVTPCLRCVFRDPPAAGEVETCDTAGVLAAAAGVVASLQVAAAMRVLVGAKPPFGSEPQGRRQASLVTVDAWDPRLHAVDLSDARSKNCITCVQKRFEFLDASPASAATVLCGRDTVQVRPASLAAIDLPALATRLGNIGQVEQTQHLVRCNVNGVKLTVFPDGRALVHGTSDRALARSIYARYIGA